MKKLLVAALASLALPAALGGCHSCEGQARFWSVNGGTAYTVDTIDAPLGMRIPAQYVDRSGRKVELADAAISSISEAQYTTSTSGAGYSLSYCPIMKACWSLPKER